MQTHPHINFEPKIDIMYHFHVYEASKYMIVVGGIHGWGTTFGCLTV